MVSKKIIISILGFVSVNLYSQEKTWDFTKWSSSDIENH